MNRRYWKYITAAIGIVVFRSNPVLGGIIGLIVGVALEAGWFKPRERAATAAAQANDAYGVLGLAPDASDAQVDLAYRRLVTQVHPDKLASASPAEQAEGEARTRVLNVAYDHIKTLRRQRQR